MFVGESETFGVKQEEVHSELTGSVSSAHLKHVDTVNAATCSPS